jgi:CheY-like chemotaxis protein
MSKNSGYLLIVEDDPDIRKLLDTTLTFKGYRVVTAPNGKDALDVVEKELPAIVVADIMMPHLDGFGLIHRLRINPDTRNIPVVFITATYVAPEDKEFALNIGATRFIQKPVDLEMFLKTVADVLESSKPIISEPLDEFNFYNGYRERMEAKLEQKIKQITREEHLLESGSDAEVQDLQVSLRHAVKERDELQLLLGQIRKQLEKFRGPEQNSRSD